MRLHTFTEVFSSGSCNSKKSDGGGEGGGRGYDPSALENPRLLTHPSSGTKLGESFIAPRGRREEAQASRRLFWQHNPTLNMRHDRLPVHYSSGSAGRESSHNSFQAAAESPDGGGWGGVVGLRCAASPLRAGAH